VMAGQGLVAPDGLRWWWAVLPVAAVALLSPRLAPPTD